MAIDFTIPDDAKDVRARVRQWVQDECIPAEQRLVDGETLDSVRSPTRSCRWSWDKATLARCR